MKLALVNLSVGEIPPLCLCYLASYLRKYGFNDTIIVDEPNPLKRIKKENPDIVGLSSMTHAFPEAKKLAGEIKQQFDIPIIIGGHHISLLPQHFRDSPFDLAVIGEGEQTLLELINALESNRKLDNVRGVIFRKGKKVIMTPPRPLIENLDSIPYPALDLIDIKKYLTLTSMTANPGVYMPIVSSRGCPYKCVYCSTTAFWKRARLRSADCVVDEVKYLVKKYKVDQISIWDDLFVTSKQRVKDIVNRLKQEGLDYLEFCLPARANLMDAELCDLLKQMNTKQIGFGFESGSPKILNYLKCGNVTVEQNKNAIRLCKKNHIKVHGYFVVGSPDETDEDLQKTYDLAQQCDQIQVFQLMPLPATVVWEQAKAKGIVSEDTGFDLTKLRMIDAFKEDLVMTNYLSAKRLEKWYWLFQDLAFKKMRQGLLENIMRLQPKYIKQLLKYSFIKKAYGMLISNIKMSNIKYRES